MDKGKVAVFPIKLEDLHFKVPKSLIDGVLKKMMLPTDIKYIKPYVEAGGVFLVTYDNEPIGCFIGFVHQGRDLTDNKSLALTVLSLACKRRYKSLVIAAAIKCAMVLKCDDFHYYEEPGTRVKLSPFMNITARPAKHFYRFQVQNVNMPYDFIFADANGNVIWEQDTETVDEMPVPVISKVEDNVVVEGEEFHIGDQIAGIIDKLDDYELADVDEGEWSTNLPTEVFEKSEEGDDDYGFEFEENSEGDW